MNDSHIVSIAQIKSFLKLNNAIEFKSQNKKETYLWIENVLQKFKYFSLRKKDKNVVKNYILKMTGLSDAQVQKLILRKKKFGKLWLGSTRWHRFEKIYKPEDNELSIVNCDSE